MDMEFWILPAVVVVGFVAIWLKLSWGRRDAIWNGDRRHHELCELVTSNTKSMNLVLDSLKRVEKALGADNSPDDEYEVKDGKEVKVGRGGRRYDLKTGRFV